MRKFLIALVLLLAGGTTAFAGSWGDTLAKARQIRAFFDQKSA